ncbi:MAG: hypothetical protein M1489_00165 [Firmicutes bacterium]|nr:hypothetical protein [Bacillota bacterium]
MPVDKLRPNPTEILKGLKDFQRNTVEYVFKRLYLDEQTASRFLVADEVGLGKTLVARGIIAKAVDYLWDEVKRLDIIYICSNAEIARQNISRLNITGQKDFSLSSRITLLPINLENIKRNKVNFVSFTPGTSFDLRSQGGVKKERALIYHILKEEWGLGNRKRYMNVFQGGAGDSWPDYLAGFLNWNKIDEDLSGDFVNKLNARSKRDDDTGVRNIKIRFEEMAESFDGRRKQSNQDWYDRNKLIGELREILAESCITALEPDLIILDEFQRFKHLLDGEDQLSQLAGYLFNYKKAKTVLLSATPYKMYTMHHEEDDNHYEDFIRTADFLFKSEDMTRNLQLCLKNYRNELYQVNGSGLDNLYKAKQQIEAILTAVMTRTERMGSTLENDGMVREIRRIDSPSETELISYVRMDNVSRILGAGNPLEYWKSSPYLLNFMENYKIKKEFELRLENQDKQLSDLVKEVSQSLLPWKTIMNYKKVDPCNSKLRMLIEDTISNGAWQLLWMPPSLPYYRPQGVYADPKLDRFTKALVFSSWNVVPKVISTICSYEAERKMVGLFDKKAEYTRERRRRRPLLRFARQEGRLAGMSSFTLFFPCTTLAQKIDPFSIAAELCDGKGIPDYNTVFQNISCRIRGLLEDSGVDLPVGRVAQEDERWYWAAPVILDRHFYPDIINDWLEKNGSEWREMVKSRQDSETDGGFADHVDALEDFFESPADLGPVPGDLVDVLTKAALGSPAVTALRSLNRWWKGFDPYVLSTAAQIAMGFRNLYNLPESITLIRGLNDKESYWKRVMEYGSEGNLQAVLDEYFHVLYESLNLSSSPDDEAVKMLADHLYSAVSLRTVNLDFDEIKLNRRNSEVLKKNRSLRCRYALRFGKGKNDQDDEVTRQDQVRSAFNSPFRPFILATTSIGQEGLDFHQYCHSIYHWNLPSNPVDLEQREGRIHRYKGHVIRKNVALKNGLACLAGRKACFEDPWEELFSMALEQRGSGFNDLVPFWIFEVENGYKVERHVPLLPLSRDLDHLEDLKKTSAAYRMVFGQARQEDLLNFLVYGVDDNNLIDILKLKIDLTPR